MKEILFEGQVVSIGHLAPMEFNCPCPDLQRDLVIAVAFSNHCYSKSFDEAVHSAEDVIVYGAGSRARVFCPIRYELSIRLPAIVASLPEQKVYQTAEQRNYVFAVPLEIEGQHEDSSV